MDDSAQLLSDQTLLRAEERRQRALKVVETLGLLERWSRYGHPVVVGAVRMGLAVALDVDMEIYSDDPKIEHGFEVMSQVALLPGVWKIRFSNELAGPDRGLYWQIRYRDRVGDVWKVDSWLLARTHPHGHWAEAFADAMHSVLTDETRRAILTIKEALLGEPDVRGIDVYRAVLEGGVRRPDEFMRWVSENRTVNISDWRPETG